MLEDLNAKHFEDEVRRIARQLWPQARYQGASIRLGRERDGIFETEDVVHLVEATTSTKMEKAEKDAEKLANLRLAEMKKRSDVLVQCWFVTREEPTADQRDVFRKLCPNARVSSLDQFRKRLFDIGSYLEQRWKYPFGSVRDPATDSAHYDLKYVPLDVVGKDGKLWTLADLADALTASDAATTIPKYFVLTGDYGAGKSSTMREVFKTLRKRYYEGMTPQFPLLLNLRDHHGEDDPDEALRRHAKKVGDVDGAQLVRAWRAGYATVLLDGFDEIGTTGLAMSQKRLSTIRHHATALIRNFNTETPPFAGVLISGRRYYFDKVEELNSALGLGSRFYHLSLNEFSDEQVARYLSERGWNGVSALPAWLPSRPLLLGYLAARGLLDETLAVDVNSSPAAAWNQLLDLIYRREQGMAAGIEAESIRMIIERLASVARGQGSHLGEFSSDTISAVFSEVCGFPPEDPGMGIIQRLPGLGVKNSETGTRCFMDETLAEAAAAGDVARFATSPYQPGIRCDFWLRGLSRFSIEVADVQIADSPQVAGLIRSAIKTTTQHRETGALGSDLIRLLCMRGADYDGSGVTVTNVELPTLEFEAEYGSMAGITFHGVIIERLEIAPEYPKEKLPYFSACCVESLEGRASRSDLPIDKFAHDVSIERFDSTTVNTNAILDLEFSMPVRVLLTVLRKLFLQSGTGRREAALFRGLDGDARRCVKDVIDLLSHHLFISPAHYSTHTVWLPSRKGNVRDRAVRMLKSPATSSDPVLLDAKKLQK